MDLAHFAIWIGVPEDAAKEMERYAPPQAETEQLLSLLEQDTQAFLDRLETLPHPEQAALYLFTRCALEQQEWWGEQKFPLTVYHDTMHDIAIWCHECRRRTGKWGLVEWGWIASSVKRSVYRLGRLQYQPGRLEEPLELFGREYDETTAVLWVHIPADGPLDPQDVRRSLQQAKDFFSQDQRTLIGCNSWLLSPALQALLPADSNILRFGALFDVCREDFSFRQAEERVFGEISDDVSGYPEHTSLQKNLKRFLLDGRKVGMGLGFLKPGIL